VGGAILMFDEAARRCRPAFDASAKWPAACRHCLNPLLLFRKETGAGGGGSFLPQRRVPEAGWRPYRTLGAGTQDAPLLRATLGWCIDLCSLHFRRSTLIMLRPTDGRT